MAVLCYDAFLFALKLFECLGTNCETTTSKFDTALFMNLWQTLCRLRVRVRDYCHKRVEGDVRVIGRK